MGIEFGVPFDFECSSYRLLWPGEHHLFAVFDFSRAFEPRSWRQISITDNEAITSRTVRLITASSRLNSYLCRAESRHRWLRLQVVVLTETGTHPSFLPYETVTVSRNDAVFKALGS